MPATAPSRLPRGRATILLLATLTALGQFSTNIYLPSLPAIATALAAPIAQVQLTLTVFLATVACSQLVYGPMADRLGRRPILLAGIAIYVAGSLLGTLAPDLATLMLARVLQALGAGAAVVVARAVVRDCFEGAEIARVMGAISAAFAIVPALVPLLGGFLQEHAGWRWTFAAATLLGAIMLALVARRLPETNRSRLDSLRPAAIAAAYGEILRERAFRRFVLASCGGMAGVFGFYAGSPDVFINRLGVSPSEFGLYPPFTVSGFVIGSQLARRLAERKGEAGVVSVGIAIMIAGAFLIFLPPFAGFLDKFALVGGSLVFVTGFGATVPACVAAALRRFASRAGSAAALIGFCQMGGAALGAAIVSALHAPLGDLAYPATMLGAALFAGTCFALLRER